MPVKQNPRGAGRKQSLTTEQIDILMRRHEAGEHIGALAQECGVSRQTLSKYLNHPIQQKEYRRKCAATLIAIRSNFLHFVPSHWHIFYKTATIKPQ